VEELGLGFVRLADGITLDIIEAWAIHLGGLDGSSLVGDKGGLRLEPFGFFESQGDLNLDTTFDLEAFARRTHDLRADTDLGSSHSNIGPPPCKAGSNCCQRPNWP